jgi:indole-3-pyruvate monooxygenase
MGRPGGLLSGTTSRGGEGSSPSGAAGTAAQAIVVGAGPGGLATAACLELAGVRTIVLERAHHVGSAWHGHYDRLHLHTTKRISGLPHLPFPEHHPRYPSREQVIEYLESYSEYFDLRPRLGQEVRSARRHDGGWIVETQDGSYTAPYLVIATGYNRVPHEPEWPGREEFAGPILHSSRYRSGEPFRGQRVLVIGFGNSGAEIALDLREHGARPSVAVRSPVNVTRRELLGIPISELARLLRRLPPRVADALTGPITRLARGDLTRYGLRTPSKGSMASIAENGRIPVIDVGTIELIKKGEVLVFPGVERFTDSGVVFTDGRAGQFDAVVLATGFRSAVGDFLDAPEALDESGNPVASGREVAPGLFFCGLKLSGTGLLRAVGVESQAIAAAIAASIGPGALPVPAEGSR